MYMYIGRQYLLFTAGIKKKESYRVFIKQD